MSVYALAIDSHPATLPEQFLYAPRGIIGETQDPGSLIGAVATTSQVIYLCGVGLRGNVTVSQIGMAVQVAGAGATPTLIKLGLYNRLGAKLGETANIAGDAGWTSVGVKLFPLTTPIAITGADIYYCAFLSNGVFATPLQPARGTTTLTALRMPAGMKAVYYTWGSANTDLPATVGFQAINETAYYFVLA